MASYYAYVADDERNDGDFPCAICVHNSGCYCELHRKIIFDDDSACEFFEFDEKYAGMGRDEVFG